jgi:predicted outer membrane protein
MIREFAIAFVTAAALATGVMAADDQSSGQSGQQGTIQQRAQQMRGEMTGQQDAMSANPDRAFAATAISHARLERQISDLVAQKATNPQVKQLAQEVSKDYQDVSQRVQQAAQKAGITVHPDRLLPRDQAILDHMQQLPVSVLERNYVFHEAGANQSHMLFSQWAAKNAQKPEIKQAAQDLASKLQQRNQTIQQLAQAEVSGGAMPAGERVGPGGQ